MTDSKKTEIAESFSNNFSEAELKIKLAESEFKTFEDGIYARSMDEKWNIFLIENDMYWARSWNNKCIYKVRVEKQNKSVELKSIKVTRNPNEYKSNDLEYDIGLFKRMLDFYLNKKMNKTST